LYEILENYLQKCFIKFDLEADNLFLFLLFWFYLGLNSGSHSCLAGAVPLEPLYQPKADNL
jgi:hypothetical protein